jgi:hypothetical protein
MVVVCSLWTCRSGKVQVRGVVPVSVVQCCSTYPVLCAYSCSLCSLFREKVGKDHYHPIESAPHPTCLLTSSFRKHEQE